MWHYVVGSADDFDGLPDECVAIVQTEPGAPLVRVAVDDDWPSGDPRLRRVVGYRKWITDDGWIEWSGGAQPAIRGEIDVRLRGGAFICNRSASFLGGSWQHDGGRKDIVAYRPHPKPVYDESNFTPINWNGALRHMKPAPGSSEKILSDAFFIAVTARPGSCAFNEEHLPPATDEPSDLVKASPLLKELLRIGMNPREVERRARRVEALKERYAHDPWHLKKAEKDPDYWHLLYARMPNW